MKRILFIMCLSILGTFNSNAQNNLKTLEEIGFENLSEIQEEGHYYLSYENNRYRYEGDALIVVLENLKLSVQTVKVSILILNRGIGITSISFDAIDLVKLKNGELSSDIFTKKSTFSFSVDKLIAKFEALEKANSSYLKAETIVGLNLDYALGNFDNSIRQKLNFQPELFSVIGKGAVISGRYNIPTFNEIDQENQRLRMARITQDIRWKDNIFLNLNFGFFTPNRYGFSGRVDRYLGSERLKMRFDFGITRGLSLDENFKIQIENNINTFNMAGGIDYRWNRYNTDISIRYGSYLLGDTGYKASLKRQFDEVFIGLFVNKTTFGQIAGFDFQIPLSFKRHMKNNGFRVRAKDFFYLDYNYRYDSDLAAEYFQGSSILSQIQEYYPNVLREKVEKYYSKKLKAAD